MARAQSRTNVLMLSGLLRGSGCPKQVTFREIANAYIKAYSAGWRNPKHRAQWPNTLHSHVYPIIGDLPVSSIDTDRV
jgi:hypothetical protein